MPPLPLSVNAALARLDTLDGQPTYITGLLTWAFEDRGINHWPRGDADGYGFWLEAATPVFAFDDDVLRRWSGKRVVVGGYVERPPWPVLPGMTYAEPLSGWGHMGLWPAELRVTSIVLYKTWLRHHPA